MTDKVHQLLQFWFGHLGSADLPSSDRTSLWFGENEVIKNQIIDLFKPDYDAAVHNQLDFWKQTPRGQLALIILLDQFSRFIFRNSAQAFSNDAKAQTIS